MAGEWGEYAQNREREYADWYNAFKQKIGKYAGKEGPPGVGGGVDAKTIFQQALGETPGFERLNPLFKQRMLGSLDDLEGMNLLMALGEYGQAPQSDLGFLEAFWDPAGNNANAWSGADATRRFNRVLDLYKQAQTGTPWGAEKSPERAGYTYLKNMNPAQAANLHKIMLSMSVAPSVFGDIWGPIGERYNWAASPLSPAFEWLDLLNKIGYR